MWDKEQYLYWLKTRSKRPAKWDIKDCREADKLVYFTAMQSFKHWAHDNIREPKVRDFLMMMVKNFFGSVEVDDLLTHLKCYPDWMEDRDTK